MGAATAIQVNLLAFSEEFDLDHQDEPERTNIIEKKESTDLTQTEALQAKAQKYHAPASSDSPPKRSRKEEPKLQGKGTARRTSLSAKEVNKVPFRCVLYKVQQNLLLQPPCIKSSKTYDVLRV